MLLGLLLVALAPSLGSVCNSFDHFPNTPTVSDAGFVATFTSHGIKCFTDAGLAMAQVFLNTIVFPDQKMHFDLGFTSVEFSLKNLRLPEFSIGNMDFRLGAGSNKSELILEDFNTHIVFDFSFKQLSAPYLSDEGIGSIILKNVNVYDAVLLGISHTCPYHMEVNLSDINAHIGSLDVDLHSPLADVLAPIIKLILKPLTEFAEKVIASAINNEINKAINNMFNTESTTNDVILCLTKHACPEGFNYSMDGRSLEFHATDTYITVKNPGTIYVRPTNATSDKDYDILDKQEGPKAPLPDLVNSADIQFIIDRSTFNSVFFTWQKHNKTFDDRIISTTASPIEYLTVDALESVFAGLGVLDTGNSSDVTVTYTHDSAPYIDKVGYAGMHTLMSILFGIQVGSLHLATVKADMEVVGEPHSFNYVDTKLLNISSFYLTFSYATAVISVIDVNKDVKVHDENLELLISTVFDSLIAEQLSTKMKSRSFYTSNSLFYGNMPYQVIYYPPEYCAVTFSFLEN